MVNIFRPKVVKVIGFSTLVLSPKPCNMGTVRTDKAGCTPVSPVEIKESCQPGGQQNPLCQEVLIPANGTFKFMPLNCNSLRFRFIKHTHWFITVYYKIKGKE